MRASGRTFLGRSERAENADSDALAALAKRFRDNEEKASEGASDPPVSEAQRRAMWAAAEGRSQLGIPESVGKEFVAADGIALDYASVREVDVDGRLRVAITNISKANVCPYNGEEIPDWQALGLDPKHVYRLLRDPEELAKAAPTFNSVPLFLIHKPTSAADHPRQITVGTTGTDAVFADPYLKNSLAVWDGEGIDLIRSNKAKELSCGYRYRADMRPGVFRGESYDGVMRDIVGNHVALVPEGRAGPDVVVGDSKHTTKQEITMKTSVLSAKAAVAAGALTIYLKPLLAADAKIDLGPALKGLTEENFGDRKDAVSAKIVAITKGKLAADAKLDGLAKVMDSIEDIEASDADPDDGEMSDAEKEKAAKDKRAKDKRAKDKRAKDAAAGESEKRKFLENTLSEDEMASWDAMCAAARDAEIEEPDESKEDNEEEKPAVDKGKGKRAKDEDPGEKMVTKAAMDEAIKIGRAQATADAIATQRAIRIAEEEVAPIVGKLTMSFDSAESVYKQALKMRGVEIAGVHPSAFRVLVKNLPVAKKAGDPAPLAMDASGQASFKELFPGAGAPVSI